MGKQGRIMRNFQFGLVSGERGGKVVKYPEGKRLEFTREGNDECDHAHGSGWVKIKEKDLLDGEFRFHGESGKKICKVPYPRVFL